MSSKKAGMSRRDVLRRTGIAVGSGLAMGSGLAVHAAGRAGSTPAQDDPGGSLTAAEYATVDAICARIIPADENGPGAGEAMAARYIDRGLDGALASSLTQYRDGLAALDEYARSVHDEDFRALSEEQQDAILESVAEGDAPGFGSSAQFFNMVRTHTIQGTFSDPIYGGNANFVGWDMIGYPGARAGVPARYQQMDEDHTPNHQSAYGSNMFNLPSGVSGSDL